MMVAIYIIGSAFSLLVLAHKLREARQEVHCTRRQLRHVTWERDAYARTAQAPVPAPDWGELTATTVTGQVLPPAGPAFSLERRPGE
jgi:hypothetical protein